VTPSLYGVGDLSLFNNLPGTSGNITATFYFAQVDPIYAGKTLTAQLYDPASGSWSMTGSLAVFRAVYTMTRLLNGRVLVAGTPPNTEEESESAELYTP
ncbi:MAG: hypothetical protein ACXU86_18780, partial [Archangium sp.]